DDWRQETQHVAVCSSGQCDDTLFAGFYGNIVDQLGQWFFGFWVNELDGHHRTTATNIADTGIFFLCLGEVLRTHFTDVLSLICQAFFLHDLQGSQTGCPGSRVATITATYAPCVAGVHNFGPSGNGR